MWPSWIKGKEEREDFRDHWVKVFSSLCIQTVSVCRKWVTLLPEFKSSQPSVTSSLHLFKAAVNWNNIALDVYWKQKRFSSPCEQRSRRRDRNFFSWHGSSIKLVHTGRYSLMAPSSRNPQEPSGIPTISQESPEIPEVLRKPPQISSNFGWPLNLQPTTVLKLPWIYFAYLLTKYGLCSVCYFFCG